MSVFKTIIGLLTGNIVKDVGEAFDRNFTTKEERDEAMCEMEQKYNERLQIIAEITDTDSWLSKNVRPMCLLVVLGTLSVILIFKIEVDPGLLKQYTTWTGIIVGFYFGVRQVEKFVKRKKNQ